jgi:neopullulanase
MKATFTFLLALVSCIGSVAQQPAVYPPNWWAGMNHNTIQLMVYGKSIARDKPTVTLNYPGITVQKILFPENENYIFIDITIADETVPGKFPIQVNRRSQPHPSTL